MIKLIIIDDENKARETIADILRLYCPNVEILAQCENVKTGIAAIQKYSPDLILLDINMPDGSGFDLLRQLEPVDFKVIFITAYEEFAIKAIKFSALDYIVKPVDPDELIEAINKAEQFSEKEDDELKLKAVIANLESGGKESKKIILKTAERIFLVNVQDITRCEADKSYTTFYLCDGRKLLVSKTIKEFDELLTGFAFFRPHQSHLINIAYIVSYEKKEGGYLRMKDNSMVPVSQRKRDILLELFEKL
ncbi:MAG: response regulator transcription factor [Bacteroidia bacterium]|nr:response regulator transcription factor [Bacteroidia bacterium]